MRKADHFYVPVSPWKVLLAFFTVAAILFSTSAVGQTHTDSTDITEAGDTVAVQKSNKDTVSYDADVIEYDINGKILLLTGNGVVHYGNMVLYSDTIHYLIPKKEFVATGHPMLIDAGDTVVGVAMTYNLATRRGRVSVASATSSDTRYNGELISKSDSNTYYIQDGDYSSCTVIDTPHYVFYAKHIKVEPSKRAISRPIILNIGQAPVAAFPYYILPLEHGRRSGWLRPRWGGNPAAGGYMENIGYYWAPNDYMDYTLATKVSEFRDVVFTGSSSYALRYWLGGNIEARWAQGGDFRSKNQNWSVNFSHNQNLLPDESFTLSGSGSVLSDKTFYRNFSEDTTELLNQNITADLALNKRFTKLNASASLAWRRSHNLRTNYVDEDIPSFTFSLPSRPLVPQPATISGMQTMREEDIKWYNKIYYGYNARVLQKNSYNVDSSKAFGNLRRGLNHGASISAPQKLFKYITVSPNINISQSFFDAYIDTTTYHRFHVMTLRDTIAQMTVSDRLIDTMTSAGTTRYIVERDTTMQSVWYDTTFWYESAFTLPKAETHSWSMGVNMSSNIYGLFPISIFNLAGIRHTMTPSVGYTFYPPIESGLRYPSFGIPADIARKGQQSVSFSVGNLFQGKTIKPPKKAGEKPQEYKFSIVSGSISTSYNFIDEGNTGWNGTWSDIGISANTAYKIFNVSYGTRLSVYTEDGALDWPVAMSHAVTLRPDNLSASGTFWGGDLLQLEKLDEPSKNAQSPASALNSPSWRFSLSPSYSFTATRKSRVEERFIFKKDYHLSTSLSMNFTDKWMVSTGGYYNFMTNRFEGMSFAFHCDLECWDLDFDWYPSGWNSGSFRFFVGIKKHPDIHWEQKNQ